jgi:hypothetical protein
MGAMVASEQMQNCTLDGASAAPLQQVVEATYRTSPAPAEDPQCREVLESMPLSSAPDIAGSQH